MTIHERNAVIQPCHFLRQDDLDTPASKTKLRGNLLVLEYSTWSNITKGLSSDEECDELSKLSIHTEPCLSAPDQIGLLSS